MRMNLKRLVTYALLLLIAACAKPEIGENTAPADVRDRGIVIVSVTHDYATGAQAEPVFFLSSSAGPGAKTPLQLRSRPNIAGIGRSDFSDTYGHVYVLNLDPGTHLITNWQTGSGKLRVVPRDAPPPLRFDVKANEVIYIGNLNVNHKMGRMPLAIVPTIMSALPEVRDRRTVDLPIAERKAPVIKGRVVNRLLPRGEWYGASRETERQTEE